MAARRTLLVEGKDDKYVLEHLCGVRGVPEQFEVKSIGSVHELLESLPVHLKASTSDDIVGVVVDADTDVTSRWQSLRASLIRMGYENIPQNPVADGGVFEPPSDSLLPRVGVWLMPNNKANGILEDFLRFLVPAGSRLFEHAQSSIATIPKEERRFSKAVEPKAAIHTWLAWQAEPGKPLGTAITARYLDPGVDEVDELVAWLNRLFFS